MPYRDEILAATIDAIAKSQHVYVTTAKLTDILERALAEQREGIAEALEEVSGLWGDNPDPRGRAKAAALQSAAEIARTYGQEESK